MTSDRQLLEELHRLVDQHLEYRGSALRRGRLFSKMVEIAEYLGTGLNRWDPSTEEHWPKEYIAYFDKDKEFVDD